LNSICLTGQPRSEPIRNSSDHERSFRRQCNRQKQFDAQVESALHAFNEHDDEGRTRPVGRDLSVDDVGRTVLRRPTDDNDWDRIEKLFNSNGKKSTAGVNASSKFSPHPLLENDEKEPPCKTSPFVARVRKTQKPSTLILLLCRAIASHDDPPLGCAVINVGFSMETGRQLHLVEIAKEPHLPQERFIECLESFSRCMKCSLTVGKKDVHDIVSVDEQKYIIQSHQDVHSRYLQRHDRLADSRVSLPLQSVKEESEVSDTSVAEQRNKKRPTSKPSKRSRVE